MTDRPSISTNCSMVMNLGRSVIVLSLYSRAGITTPALCVPYNYAPTVLLFLQLLRVAKNRRKDRIIDIPADRLFATHLARFSRVPRIDDHGGANHFMDATGASPDQTFQ